MSNTTNLKQRDKLHTQENVKETHNNTSLYEKERLENTPFDIVTIKETNEIFLALGNARLTNYDDATTKDELIKYLDKHRWRIISDMIIFLAKRTYEHMREAERQAQKNGEKPL